MQFDQLRRREFITLVGSVAAWPFAARAQQSTLPVVGFPYSQSPDAFVDVRSFFRQGLKETGFVEGENVAIADRWAENQAERLTALIADLVRQRVAVLAVLGNAAAQAAKTATTTVPIVFAVGEDPVRLGLVASLARPGGNLTGINFFVGELAAKRLELLRELVPRAVRVAVLVNPANPNAETILRDVGTAARAMGMQLQVCNAGTIDEIDTVFTTFARERPDALFVGPDPLFLARRVQLVLLAASNKIPTTYGVRNYVEAGGLISYGASFTDAARQVGVYAGRILRGAKPADLPVVQATKFELVINAQAAKVLGLTVPPSLLSVADEVIE
jgi:putative ABC transport system substrate-binding protein